MTFEFVAGIIGIDAFSHLIGPGGRLVHYVDSRPALIILVKGYSRQTNLSDLVGNMWFNMSRIQLASWAEHVASASNLADGPSRLNYALMKALGARKVKVDLTRHTQSLTRWFSQVELVN